jgi:hypothetical protein
MQANMKQAGRAQMRLKAKPKSDVFYPSFSLLRAEPRFRGLSFGQQVNCPRSIHDLGQPHAVVAVDLYCRFAQGDY